MFDTHAHCNIYMQRFSNINKQFTVWYIAILEGAIYIAIQTNECIVSAWKVTYTYIKHDIKLPAVPS